MSSLADLPEVIGFFSYSREDDESYKGRLSALREGIQHELSAQLGRTKATFRLWQDKEAIAPGKLWEAEIRTAVAQSVFFIPIVTPRAVNSKYCQFEFESFLERERALGRADLVFPILYVPVPALENEARWRDHAVLSAIAKRQYVDWQTFRYADVDTPLIREAIARFCRKIVEALQDAWLTPEERERNEAADAARRAEEERRQQETEAKQRAEEERRRQEAEEKRLAEEAARVQAAAAEEQRRREEADARQRRQKDEQRRQEEREAAAWTALPQPLTADALHAFLREFPKGAHASAAEAALATLVGIERAFEAAKRADTLAAIERFLADHPGSHLAQNADALRAQIAARTEAYASAMTSDDPAALKAILEKYPRAEEARKARERLETLTREQAHRTAMASNDPALRPRVATRRTVLIGGAMGAGALAVGVAVLMREPSKQIAEGSPGAPNQTPRSAPASQSNLVRTLVGHTGDPFSADFSADGSRILTHSVSDKSSRLWDTKSGAAIATFSGAQYAHAKFSPDGNSLATEAPDVDPRLLDAKSGRLLSVLKGAWSSLPKDAFLSLTDVSFSPDGARILTAAAWENKVNLWDARTGAAIATLSAPANNVTALFSPDSDRILSFSISLEVKDNVVRLWDGRTGAPVARITLPRPTDDPALFASMWATFSPDGSRIVVTSSWESVARLYHGKTGAPIATLSGHTAPELSATFSRDGGRVLTRSPDKTVRLWDGKSGAALGVMDLRGDFNSAPVAAYSIDAKFSPDGSRIVTAGQLNAAKLWDGRTGRLVVGLPNSAGASSPVFSPDSGCFAMKVSDSNIIGLWSAQNGAAIATLPGPSSTGAKFEFGNTTLAGPFSPDGGRLLTRLGARADLWNVRSGERFSALTGHTDEITSGIFSPDGRLVLTLSKDNTARLWDATVSTVADAR